MPSLPFDSKPPTAASQATQAKQLFQAGQYLEAIALLEPLYQAHPQKQQLALLLAEAHIKNRNLKAAYTLLKKLLSQPAPLPHSWILAAKVCLQKKEYSQAEQLLQEAVRRHPELSQAWYELGRLHVERNQPESALENLYTAAQLNPDSFSIPFFLARAHIHLFQIREAVEIYQKLLEKRPEQLGLWEDLGNTLVKLERYDEAEKCYLHVLSKEPQRAVALTNYALLKLKQGDKAGWLYPDYLRRIQAFGAHSPSATPWDGQIRRDQPLAIIEEFGRGDFIQMLRFIPHLLAKGQPCIVCAQRPKSWERLISAMGLDLPVYGLNAWKKEDLAPYFIYDSELPRYFNSPPQGNHAPPYLKVPAGAALSRLHTGPSIGLVWASGDYGQEPVHIWSYRHRSIPLKAFAPLIQAFPEANFYSFQVGNDAAQIVENQLPIHDLSKNIGDFYDTATLLQEMDLVISVDTAAAHLAGALGKPTWLLLPSACDWRWGTTGQTTDWYPSMRLFRQKKLLDWGAVLHELRHALEQHCASIQKQKRL